MNRNRKLVNHLSENGRHHGDSSRFEATVELEPCTSRDNTDFSTTKLYQQLRPLLICMRMFGLFFRRTVDQKGRSYMEPIVLYCFFVTFLLLVNVLRSFTVYRFADDFDSVLVQKLLFTIWSSECAFKAVLLMWNCFKQNGLPTFFRQWDETCGNVKLDRMVIIMMRKYIFLSYLFIVVNSVVFTLILIYVPELEKIYLEVVWKDAVEYDNQLVFQITLSGLAVLNSASSMFPVSLFVVLSFAVGKRLKKYTDELVIAIDADEFSGKIEDFRLRHQSLCTLVDILDSMFSPMLAVVYMANIPMFCLVLYTMVTTIEVHVSLVLINMFWMGFILLQMTIVSITAAWINVKAHSPLDHIYTIRFSKTSNDIQLQMYMFLNRLTGTQVGLSAMKLFVIDKPTILTIAGMMATYFILLIQFKMPADSDCQCNVTGTVYLFLNLLTENQIGVSALGVFVVDKKALLGIAGMLVTYFVLLLELQMPNSSTCNCVLNSTLNLTEVVS